MTNAERRLNLGSDTMVRADADEHDRRASMGGTDTADQFNAYLFHNDDLRLAVEVALATRRALLLEGPSGSGKSMLAEAVARQLNWRYYREVITSRTQAEHLLWTVDHVRRIGDAQAGLGGDELSLDRYVKPGVLWWAFDPTSASTISGRRYEPLADPSRFDQPGSPAVVLLDEIDKADADMPNDLLVPLGSMGFRVDLLDEVGSSPGSDGPTIDAEAGTTVDSAFVAAVSGREPLVVITSNQERELSEAFLRRCVRYRIDLPDRATYEKIARAQVPTVDTSVLSALAESLVSEEDTEQKVSIATFIDAVRACSELGIDLSTDEGQRLVGVFQHWRPRTLTGGRGR